MEEEQGEVQQPERHIEKYRETPRICSFLNADLSKLIIEIEMQFIDKKDISLLVDDNGFFLSTSGEDQDYLAAMPFIAPVKSQEAAAVYLDDGTLTIEAPLREPFTKARAVPIR